MLIDVFCDTSQRFKVLFNMQAVLTLQAVTLQRLPQWYLCAAMVHQPPGLLLAVTRVARSNIFMCCSCAQCYRRCSDAAVQ